MLSILSHLFQISITISFKGISVYLEYYQILTIPYLLTRDPMNILPKTNFGLPKSNDFAKNFVQNVFFFAKSLKTVSTPLAS